jgi:hypothetical protein
MLPKLLVVTPFPIHKPTKILRPESSGNHVIKLKWWRIVWITIVFMMKIKPITDYIQMIHII